MFCVIQMVTARVVKTQYGTQITLSVSTCLMLMEKHLQLCLSEWMSHDHSGVYFCATELVTRISLLLSSSSSITSPYGFPLGSSVFSHFPNRWLDYSTFPLGMNKCGTVCATCPMIEWCFTYRVCSCMTLQHWPG